MKRIGLFLLSLTLFVGVNAAVTINVDSLKKEIIKSSKEIQEQKKDSITFSKLSAEQILELKKGEQEVRKQEIENEGRSDMPLNGLGIVIICLLPFLFVVGLVIIQSKVRSRESQRRYDIYLKSIEMGQTVPEHFFDEPKKANPSSNLQKGILALAVGIALIIYFTIIHNNMALIAGIVPAFVGIGFLLVHFLEKPKTESTINNDEQHG